jgi:hypothetical protein
MKVQLSLFLTNHPLPHEVIWCCGCIDPRFLVSALVEGESGQLQAPASFLPCRSIVRILDRLNGELKSRSGRYGEENIIDPLEIINVDYRSSRPETIAIPTVLSRLKRLMVMKLDLCVCFKYCVHCHEDEWEVEVWPHHS